jgi:hypothetical protein
MPLAVLVLGATLELFRFTDAGQSVTVEVRCDAP